jgi:putative beta-lysine N-acetyltransferase
LTGGVPSVTPRIDATDPSTNTAEVMNTPATEPSSQTAASVPVPDPADAGDEAQSSGAAPEGDLSPNADHIAPDQVVETAPPEWERTTPSDKQMGMVQLTLDRGVKTTVIGQLYGMDFEIEGDGYNVRLFFDNYNRRLKVLDYEAVDYGAMLRRVNELADANSFDKVFVKAHESDWQKFLPYGYQMEGILKYFYRGENAFVMSKFRTVERAHNTLVVEENALIEKLMGIGADHAKRALPDGFEMFACDESHISELVELYRDVFSTYPSPLTNPDYVQQTMRRDMIYRAIRNDEGAIVSAASAEIDKKHSNAEVTDCATTHAGRGQGLMQHLVERIVDDLSDMDIMTSYTLARAASFGMNIVFMRAGFEYCGRLINNCDIYGQYEDMNIWVKPPRIMRKK